MIQYAVEFFVIMTSILLSFYIEKQNAISYKEDLKNQSLRKLIVNIKHDISDSKINYWLHSKIYKYGKRVMGASDELFESNKDSLGLYLNAISQGGTIFVDNKEEYLALRNSGLIELIENDSLITLLQSKYSLHQYYKKIEEYQVHTTFEMTGVLTSKTSAKIIGPTGLWCDYGTYIDEQPLTNADLILIKRKLEISRNYRGFIKKSMKTDSLLIKIIHKELESTE